MHRILAFLSPLLQVLYRLYLRKPRFYRYRAIRIRTEPGVFYPGFIISTRIFLEYLDCLDHRGLSVLDLGSGTGILSFLAARKGALVTATDINPEAIRNIRDNMHRLGTEIEVIQSDLFENLRDRKFDRIILSPPYYPKDPKSYSEMAWYCGRNFDFYEKLFQQLRDHMSIYAEVLMILSQDCDLDRIRQIGRNSGFDFALVAERKRMGEWNYIFRIF